MNKISLINRVKYNKNVYTLYNCIGSKIVSLLKILLKADDRLIVFSSFGGRKFDDSPKAIYEAMINDSRFDDYQLVWAFIKPDDYKIQRGIKVRIDTFSYYKFLLRARVWVTNSSMTRGLNFTGINTFELNTWHGSAIKKMGCDINEGNKSFGLKRRKSNSGIMLAQGQYDVNVFSHAFQRPKENFRIIGFPRNDILAHVSKESQAHIKRWLDIPLEKKVILYAPTFREFEKDGKNCVMALPINLKLWRERLGQEYVLLFRAHYEVARVMGIYDDDFVKNVSDYPNLNDLLIASDMLISDYSSIYFDYAIQGKPMLCYAYDYDRYEKERGMYFDVRRYLSHAESEEELINLILSIDEPRLCGITNAFRNQYVTAYGSASKKSLDIIYEIIQRKYQKL